MTNQALMLFEPDFLSAFIGRAVYPFFVHTVDVPLSSSYLIDFPRFFNTFYFNNAVIYFRPPFSGTITHLKKN